MQYICPMHERSFRAATLPRMIIHDEELSSNLAEMQRWATAVGAHLAPHSKTTLSTAIVARQLQAGAWGATAANVRQVDGLVRAGATRIILANQVVDAVDIAWLGHILSESDSVEVFCFVDSTAGARAIDTGFRRLSIERPMQLLLEHGYMGGRAGTRSQHQLYELAESVRMLTSVRIAGVAGYEGQMPLDGGAEPMHIRPYLAEIRDLATGLYDRGMAGPDFMVTAGGSSYYDIVADELNPARFGFPVRLVLRSGCYVTHDHGIYERTGPAAAGRTSAAPLPQLTPAIEIQAVVLSTPEPSLAIAGFGRRHVPFDDQLPVVLSINGVPLEAGAGLQVPTVRHGRSRALRLPRGEGSRSNTTPSEPPAIGSSWNPPSTARRRKR